MATATLTFDLDKHEDRIELSRYQASLDMACMLHEVLLNGRKHFPDGNDIDKVWEYLWEQARDYDINLDKIIE
jgi:hypothetical protein